MYGCLMSIYAETVSNTSNQEEAYTWKAIPPNTLGINDTQGDDVILL